MSRYLARLAQRASALEQKAHAATPIPSMPTSAEVHDPFEVIAPLEPGPAPSQPPPVRAEHPEFTGMRTPAEPHLSTPALALPLLQPATSPVHADAPVIPQPIKSQPAPRVDAPIPALKREPHEQVQPAEIVEHIRVERETVREFVHHAPDKPRTPVLSPALPVHVPPAPEKLRALPKQPTTSPMPERVTPEARPPLEPVKIAATHPPASVAVSREGPRLVIGRMQVEVIPSAPVAVPQPRVTQRHRVAPRVPPTPSQLHFGLGQM